MSNQTQKHPLFVSPKDQNGISKFELNSYSCGDFLARSKGVKYSINFQRYYLFFNPPGSKGHDWQRNIFLSLINYHSIGTIEWVSTINADGSVTLEWESLDGQQRSKTLHDIFDNKICLPKGATIIVDGVQKDVTNYSYTDLWKTYPGYMEDWYKNYTFIVLESRLTKEEKHKRFVDVNNNNPLSDQDIRSSYDNPLTRELNDMVLSAVPRYKFLYVDTNKMEFVHMPKLSVIGKVIQEVISKVLIFGFQKRYTNIGKGAIDSLYEDFNDGTKSQKDIDSIKPILDQVLSTTNYVIENSTSKDFWKKRDIMILMIVIWDLIANKKKFDSKLLKTKYMKAIASLKKANSKLNQWALEVGYLVENGQHEDNKLSESIRERDNTFASCYTQGDSPIPLEFVVETIKERLLESGVIKTKDIRRNFTREEKQEVLLLQDLRCACCGDAIDIDNSSSYEGDHIVPHSEGGKTEMENCEILCLECHHIKTQTPDTYDKLRNKFFKSRTEAKIA